MRPRSRIWADAVGDKRTTEVLKDSAAGVCVCVYIYICMCVYIYRYKA
jgi:hypothetical protein